MKHAFKRALLHPVGLLGALLAGVGLLMSSVLLVLDLIEADSDPYRGIFTYLIFPPMMGFGGVLFAIMVFRQHRLKREEVARPARRRLAVTAVILVTVTIMAISMVGGLRAYKFTESVEFCGETCHVPMAPQYVAHADSPHASVECAKCHVGPGVENYVEAKLSGMRQVYKVLAGDIHFPVRAPRDKLRNANETCEHCHWPDQRWGTELDDRIRFGYDLANTRRPLQMLVKVGGAGTGIHWHASADSKVFYRALDDQHQEIPWVEVRRSDGTRTVYTDSESSLAKEYLDQLEVHEMDCLNCHNRPAHRFHTPDRAVDAALESGAVSPALPFIKKLAVDLLARKYASVEQAKESIRKSIENFYSERFEGTVMSRTESVESAIAAVASIYERNVFPQMKVDGYTHPDNVGHREFPGCFRCHGGKHKSADGVTLESRCDLCHEFARSAPGSATLQQIPADGSTLHPWTDHESHPVECWRCHTGATSPYSECGECHPKAVGGGHGMSFECSICHKPAGGTVKTTNCAPCHPVLGSPMHAAKGHENCLGCHIPHSWDAGGEETCSPCHEKLPESCTPGQACTSCHDFTGIQSTMRGLPVTRPPEPQPAPSEDEAAGEGSDEGAQ